MSDIFNFGQSANPPSTPNLKSKGSIFSQAPSTTPAGPPPSWLTNKSTTPAGPPPRESRMFESSYNASNNTFARKPNTFSGKRVFAVPESSPPLNDDDGYEDAEGKEDDMADYYMQEGDRAADETFMSSVGASPRGLKRSRNGQVRERGQSEMSAIARQLMVQEGLAGLQTSDDVVLQTEETVNSIDTTIRENGRDEHEVILIDGCVQLTKSWRASTSTKTKKGSLGPAAADTFTKANYIATLLLQLHHPHSAKQTSHVASLSHPRNLAFKRQDQASAIPVPQAMLDWLNSYHNPFPDDFDSVHLYQPSPSANESFWDIIYAEMLRGRLSRATRLLKDAGWEHAVTAVDDGSKGEGYRDHQLANTEMVAQSCIHLLESCPAVQDGNWDVRGPEWHLFRQRVRKTIAELESFAEGDDDMEDDEHAPENVFDISTRDSLSMSRSTRRAESRVPWTIYQNLKVLYRQLLGEATFIIEVCQDWLEAAILMTVWWNGDETKVDMNASLSHSLGKSMRPGMREVDVTPLLGYRRRLGIMFEEVKTQQEACFQPDTMDSMQVGLACLLEDDVESVIGLLRSWDQTVAAAVVEVAALGDWLPQARPSSRGLLQKGFSSEDLMVLSHGQGSQKFQPSGSIDRDEALATYAELLASKDLFRSSNGKVVKEGWELAISVLGRFDDANIAQARIAEVLERIEVSDETRLDKILTACEEVGLSEQGRAIAERYADSQAETGQSYGSALILYARAHATSKLKSTLALLISLCLINSAATPAQSQLDPQLASLLSKDRIALVSLARSDAEAAGLLSSHLSGYATVRRFYALRDQDIPQPNELARRLPPLERKREAATALLAVIDSAADCIRGGLFDPAVESVIPVDGLLALLGETLPLLSQPNRMFTQAQVFGLLRTVEDFDTAPGRVREQAAALLRASMNAYRATSSTSNSASSGLFKSTKGGSNSGSGLLGASSYDMLASSIMVPTSGQEGGLERSWDWRQGLDAVAESADAESGQVVSLVRIALAQEVAKRWGGAMRW